MAGKIEIPQDALEPGSGILRPPLLSVWFGTLFGLLMIAAAAWAAIINSYDMATALGFLGIVFTVAAAPQVFWRHEVPWNQKEIDGPAKMFGLTLGAARTEIAWSDIVRAGRTMSATGMSSPATADAFMGAIFVRDAMYSFRQCEVIAPHYNSTFILPPNGMSACLTCPQAD